MSYQKQTLKQCIAAITKANGNITRAAKLLGSERSALSHRISRNKELQKAQGDAKESLIDFAESQLWKKISEGHFPSIRLALLCQGKQRGWIENPLQVPPPTDEDETYNVTVTVRPKVE